MPIPKPSLNKAAPPPPPPPFPPIRKALRLLSETDDSNPLDVSYVYSGYAPLSVRLVQCVAQKSAVLSSASEGDSPAGSTLASGPVLKPFASPISGWKGFEDALKLIPGEIVDVTQRPDGRDEHAAARGKYFHIASCRCLSFLVD